MPQSSGRRIRGIFASLVLTLSLAAPSAASAQSVDPSVLADPYSTSDYALNLTDGYLAFGDGMAGALPSTGGTVGATYASGGGSSGNLAGPSWFGCFVLSC